VRDQLAVKVEHSRSHVPFSKRVIRGYSGGIRTCEHVNDDDESLIIGREAIAGFAKVFDLG
jgi:hypothetical protein